MNLKSLGSLSDEVIPHVSTASQWSGFQALNNLFGQPYWKRVWVIQELTVAYNVTILYGGLQLSWADLSRVFAMLNELTSNAVNDYSRTEQFLDAMHLLPFRQHYQLERKPISLLDAMKWSARTLATDPRDKIFALLGMCHDGTTFVPIPNYKQPLETIIVEMSKAMISLNRSLDLMVLKGTQSQKRELGTLPSWIPDWPTIWSGGMTHQESTIQDWQHTYRFNPIFDRIQGRLLRLTGGCLGQIVDLTSGMRAHDRDAPSRLPIYPWISSTKLLTMEVKELDNPSLHDLSIQDMIWKSLTMDFTNIDSTVGNQRYYGLHFFSQLWMPEGRGSVQNLDQIDWIDRNVYFKLGRWTLREWSRMNDKWHELSPDGTAIGSATLIPEHIGLRLFIQALEEVLRSGMRLASVFRDDGQHLPCMVHPDAQEGDSIFVLRGCSVPLVLRRAIDSNVPDDKAQWRVIGGVYADINFHPLMAMLKRWKDDTDPGSLREKLREVILC